MKRSKKINLPKREEANNSDGHRELQQQDGINLPEDQNEEFISDGFNLFVFIWCFYFQLDYFCKLCALSAIKQNFQLIRGYLQGLFRIFPFILHYFPAKKYTEISLFHSKTLLL